MKKNLPILSISFCLFACGDGHAEEQPMPEPMTAEKICQLAWEQNEESLEPADRFGNPFPLLKNSESGWRFEIEHEGQRLFMAPSQSVVYQVELETGALDCEVPISWKVLDSRLEVSFDPQFKSKRQITMINGQAFGSETKGGIYLRHLLLPHDPHDINLAWFLKSPPLNKAELSKAVRERLQVPSEQTLEILQAADLLQQRGSMGIQAVAMSVGQSPFQYWAMVPPQAAQLWPALRFLPLGEATAETGLEQAWSKAGILDLAALKLWDPGQRKMVDCAAIATAQKISCQQVVDDAFVKIFKAAQDNNKDTCLHLAWPGAEFSPYFISSFCVEPNGSIRALGSKAVLNPGFPTAAGQGR